jgi:hypothetical protein
MSETCNQLKQLRTFASQQIHPRPRRSLSTFRLSTEPRRMRWLGLLLIFNLSLLAIQSCGLDIEDPTPLSPPEWVQKSLPEEWPERGIDAHESGGIFLEWEPSNQESIAAYLIYRSQLFTENDSFGKFELLSRIETIVNANYEYIDTEVVIRNIYFYTLKVEDVSEKMSDFSDSLKYSLLPQIQAGAMVPNGTTEVLNSAEELVWQYVYEIEMEDYCLTLLTQDNEFVCREIITPRNFTSGLESWTIPNTVSLAENKIYKWRVDMGAQYHDELESVGSESPWATFLFTAP